MTRINSNISRTNCSRNFKALMYSYMMGNISKSKHMRDIYRIYRKQSRVKKRTKIILNFYLNTFSSYHYDKSLKCMTFSYLNKEDRFMKIKNMDPVLDALNAG